MDANEYIYTASGDGLLFCFDPTGNVRWTVNLGAAGGVPTLGDDGTIYVGTTAGKLFAINGEGGPANSAWPQFQRDAQHTGSMQTYLTSARPGQITIRGIPTRSYRLEYNDNLGNAEWTVLTNYTCTATYQTFLDPKATNRTARFYRSVLLP